MLERLKAFFLSRYYGYDRGYDDGFRDGYHLGLRDKAD